MKILDTGIKDLLLLEPDIFQDSRGCFLESYNLRILQEFGINSQFVQDNESCSGRGVIRGLHFQTGKYEQAKLVRVISGRVFDVAVDLRPGSNTLGKYFSVILDGKNKRQLFIPRGFAHGFLALENDTILQYKCDNYYNKESESGIIYNDPKLSINWPVSEYEIIINERDSNFQSFEQYLKNAM